VRGKRLLDLGAGSGIVGIAAAIRGAASVIAAEVDPNGIAALKLNAVANGVSIAPIGDDLLDFSPPDVDVVAVGDLFYEAALAERVTVFLDRCLAEGIACLVGDPGRAPLPLHRLERIGQYAVPDFGGANAEKSGVYNFVINNLRLPA
jgi:predicted nicotinamide N-methyase